jgi:hypothetical protein
MTSPLRAQQVNTIYRFVRWYINITITILDIIHRPVFYLKTHLGTGLCLPSQMEATQVGHIETTSLCLWAPATTPIGFIDCFALCWLYKPNWFY